jgi:hypothetical protein
VIGRILPFGRRAALAVPCPRCGAGPGRACDTASRFMPPGFTHPERRRVHVTGTPPPVPPGCGGDAA